MILYIYIKIYLYGIINPHILRLLKLWNYSVSCCQHETRTIHLSYLTQKQTWRIAFTHHSPAGWFPQGKNTLAISRARGTTSEVSGRTLSTSRWFTTRKRKDTSWWRWSKSLPVYLFRVSIHSHICISAYMGCFHQKCGQCEVLIIPAK